MPDDEHFREEVQSKVQDIVSKRKEKSTPALVVEAVVEGVKLYRSYKKEKEEEEKKKKKKKRRRHRRGGEMGDRHRYGSRRGSRERHRHHRSCDREGHGKRGHGSRERSRDRRRNRSRHRSRDEGCRRSRSRDPVAERPSKNDDDNEYVMTGGAGPAKTLHDVHRGSAPPAGSGDRLTSPTKDRPSSSTKDYQTHWRDLTPDRDDRGRESGRRAPTPHASARKPEDERSRPRSRLRGDERRGRAPTPYHRGQRSSKDRSKSRDRSRSRHRRHRHRDPKAGEVGKHYSPTRKPNKGPDGTPFGSLPKYAPKAGLTLGFGDHVMNTYKHIKAEHDAGHRSKGMIEKILAGKGKKEPEVKRDRDMGGGDKRRDGGREERRQGAGEWKDTAAEREAYERHKTREEPQKHRAKEGERKHDTQDKEKYEKRKDHRSRDHKDDKRRKEDTDRRGEKDKCPPTPEIRVVSPTPPQSQYVPTPIAFGARRPVPSQQRSPSPPLPPEPPTWAVSAPPVPRATTRQHEPSPPIPGSYENRDPAPPSPAASDISSMPPSPPYPNTGASFPIQMPPPPSAPPPPPPPPPLPPARPQAPISDDLLAGVRGGAQLKNVSEQDNKDVSISPSAGQVVYGETAHSHEVEQRERGEEGQRSSSTWSAAGDEEAQEAGGPDRAFQRQIAEELNARMAKGTVNSSLRTGKEEEREGCGNNSSLLTGDSRSSSVSGGVRVHVEGGVDESADTPFKRMSQSESGENLIFTLSAHIAHPGWGLEGVEKKD